jgi:hypothetical protein
MARFKRQLIERPNGSWYITLTDKGDIYELTNVKGNAYMVYSLVGHELDDNDKKVDHEYGSFYIFREDAKEHLKVYNKGYERCFIIKRYVNLNKVVVDNKARKWLHLVPRNRYARPMDVA